MRTEMWIFLGTVITAAIAIVLLVKFGKLSRDSAVQLLLKCTKYVREAEKLYPEPGSGSTKKLYVLEFLEELFADVSDKLLGALIDLIVAILNATCWW